MNGVHHVERQLLAVPVLPCIAGQADCGSSEDVPPVGWEEGDGQETGPGGGSGRLLCNRSTVTQTHSSSNCVRRCVLDKMVYRIE